MEQALRALQYQELTIGSLVSCLHLLTFEKPTLRTSTQYDHLNRCGQDSAHFWIENCKTDLLDVS